MNATRLVEFVGRLLEVERAHGIDGNLTRTLEALQNLIGAPGQTAPQNEFAASVEELKKQVKAMVSGFTPAELKLLDEIEGADWFGRDFTNDLEQRLRDNALTPTVVLEWLRSLRERRFSYLNHLEQLRTSLATVGVAADPVPPGTAEIGILLPRSIFRGDFDEFIKEQRKLNEILRWFSLATTGAAEKVELKQVSTSDPFILLGISPLVIAQVGIAVSFLLSQWEKIERIRKLRAETAKLRNEFQPPSLREIDEKFTASINELIDAAIAEKVSEILNNAPARTPELEVGVKWALETLMAKIEKGMTIEIRAVPPPKADTATDTDTAARTAAATIQNTAPQLKFPKAEAVPLLIEGPEPSPAPPSIAKAS